MAELSDALHTWMAAGRFAQVDGTDVWYRATGKGPWLVCFHGFPTSSWDWHRLLPLLRRRHRVLVFDFPGYGLSAKPVSRSYSILRQCDVAEALLANLQVRDFDLLAHDMGDSVACELLYRLETGETDLDPKRVILLNGGIYPDLHHPLPTQVLLRTPVVGEVTARLAGWPLFRHQYPRVYAEPAQFDEQHYRDQWQLMLHDGGRRTLAKVACYMRERLRYRDRWLGPLHRLRRPLRVVWGREDPIAVPAIAARLARENPRSTQVMLDGVGHYPQLEDPQRVASEILHFTAAEA
jgi:pimeloyl-ACP methyl ester carboxylesterase